MKHNPLTRGGDRPRWSSGWRSAPSVLACCLPLAALPGLAGAQEKAPAESAPAKPEPAAEPATAEEAPADYSNWVEVSAGGVFVDGKDESFQRRRYLPGDTGFGGVNAVHYEKFIGEKGLLKLDGRALLEQESYRASVSLEETDKGYVRAGYKQDRTWYDGVGGYYPATGAWVPLHNRELKLDRGEAWFETGLTLPSWPEIHLRYSHLFRDGKKDSTIWGQVNVPGSTRGVGASFYDIDEIQDIFEGKVRHTVGKTDLGVGLRYEMGDIDNSLNLREFPGAPLENHITQKDKLDTDLFSAHASTETRFNEKLFLSSGYAFTTLDTDVGGSRIYGSDYDAIYDPALARGPGYVGLSGGSQLDQHVVNVNLHYALWQHLSLIPSVRLEQQDLDGHNVYYETPAFDAKSADNSRDFIDVSERLELRYTGVTNWLFYTSGDWLQGDGNLEERQRALATGTVELNRDTDFNRFTQKYTVGANWYPLRRLNFASQYYHKIRQSEYDHDQDSTPNGPTSVLRYPAFIRDQDFETDDVNFRVTWRPLMSVTLVSRYDFQLSTVDTKVDGYSEIESAELTSHIFSESATWTPLHWLYLQAGLNYVLNETTTPNSTDSSSGVVLDSENDYWQTTFTAGVALDDKTDLQAQYIYSRADNYVDNSPASQPYGAGFEEHGVTASLIRQLSKSMVWTMRYGFYKTFDEATNGETDYTAHLVYSSMAYRF